jgi:prefoldin alpha subunit
MSNVMNQEIMQMLTQMNQQHETLQEQLKIVEQQILELQHFREEMNVLESKKNNEILAPLGKSVFAKVEFSSNNKVFVDVGVGIFVQKTIPEAREVVENQTKKFHGFKAQISAELSSLTNQLEMILSGANLSK